MKYYDILLILIFTILLILYTINYLYLKKNNNMMEILEKDKVNKNELNDILRNKLPLILTGEIEDWFIFNKNDKIDNNKLTDKILKDNSYKLLYPLSISKKINVINFNKDKNTKIIKENNTRHFLGVLSGKISVYLFNPDENKNFENNNKISKYNIYKEPKKFNKVKYNEIILNNEKLLYIPYNWWYCYNIIENTKLININSESFFTLPIKLLFDKI